MAFQASRLLKGEAASKLPIETLRCQNLVVDMRIASRLDLTIRSEVLRRASRVIQ